MTIIKTLDRNDALHIAEDMGRAEQLGSYDGVAALFDYYDELSEDTGIPFEWDVVAICCDWTHYDSISEAGREYDTEGAVAVILAMLDDCDEADGDAVDDVLNDLTEWFRDQTTILELGDGSVLIQAF